MKKIEQSNSRENKKSQCLPYPWENTGFFVIAPEWIRTTDLPLRRRLLYPTELRAPDQSKHKQTKPSKPHPDFRLYAHSAKVWAKKILGKVWYFGPWNDPQGALEKDLAQKDTIRAGRDPGKLAGVAGVDSRQGCKVKLLVNSFLNAKRSRMDSGPLSLKMFQQYHEACKLLVDCLGNESQNSQRVQVCIRRTASG